MAIIGYLAPDGTFTQCNSWGHFECAFRICSTLGKEYYNGYEAERYLLNMGYIIFRARDAYMNHYKDKEYCVHSEYEHNFITEEQLDFINKHQENADWNNIDQANDVHRMLKDDLTIKRWHKGDVDNG